MAKRDGWIAYAIGAGILYWILRPRAVVAVPAPIATVPAAPVASSAPQTTIITGNPNNLLSVATPQEIAEMIDGGGSGF